MDLALSFFVGALVGSWLMKSRTDSYWIYRIRKGHIPSPDEVKDWMP